MNLIHQKSQSIRILNRFFFYLNLFRVYIDLFFELYLSQLYYYYFVFLWTSMSMVISAFIILLLMH